MIELIYGTAGSGKTTLIYEKILKDAEDDEKVILLVPEQQVLSCERELARLHDLGVPMNVQVLSFRRLANTVFRAEGGLRYDYITRGQKTVLLWRAMMSVAPMLKKYNSLTLKDRGFLSEAVRCMEEFKAYRITPDLLEEASEQIPDSQKEFKQKISDLSLCYASYRETLSRGYNDPSDDLEALIGILECSDFMGEYKVYIDSFNGYTAVEMEIVRLIFVGAKSVCISIGYDRSEGIAFASLSQADKAIRRIAAESGQQITETLLSDTLRFKNTELKYLSENIWHFSAREYEEECENIRLCTAHDIYSECEFIARDISRRIRDGAEKGERYRDYAVIVRDLEKYDGILGAMFEKYSIPHHLSSRTDITLHPAVKCVISALSVGIGSWQTDDVFSYAKCGFAGITPDECNILENYVQSWGITGKRWRDEYEWNMNPAGYSETLTEEDTALLLQVNELRVRLRTPLLGLFSRFEKDTTVREATEAVWDFITEIGLSEQLQCSGAPVWNALLEALDGMVHCAADMTVTLDNYRDLLLTLLSDADIGKIPEGNDQVTVGDASLLRLHGVEHVYISGVLEGEFPKSVGESTILSDAEKNVLASVGVRLSGDNSAKNSDELFYLWRAVSSPRSTLTVTYPMATMTGDALTPSLAVTRLRALFPQLIVTDTNSCPMADRIEGYDSSFEYAALCRGTDMGQALYDIYAEDEEYAHRLSALDIPVQNTDCALSEESVATVWKKDINLTQSRLDTFNNCAFSYYCKYVLKLSEEKKAKFAISDIGTFVHMLLERFMMKICEEGEMRLDITEEERDEIIDKLIDDYIRSVFRDRRSAPARLLTLISRLRRTAILLITDILEEFSQSDFRPAFFELEIGAEGDNALESYVIKTPEGGDIRLYGKVDRVDTYKKGDDVYVRIVDYKTGSHDISLKDVEKGRELQMLLYLFAIWKSSDTAFLQKIGAEEGEIYPAGVQYYKVKMPDITMSEKPDADQLRGELQKKLVRTGLSLEDEDIISAANRMGGARYSPGEMLTLERFGDLVGQVEEIVTDITGQMRSGDAKARWKNPDKDQCSYCCMQPICRKGKNNG